LGDWSDVVRGQVLRALAEIGDTTTVPHLIARLKDVRETPTNRVLAIRALGRLSSAKSVVWLKKQYKDYPKHAQIRREVVQALWMSRDVVKKHELYVFFRGALSDKDPMVMRKAAIYLGRLRDKQAVPLLVKMLSHSSSMLRNVSAFVLGQIGDPSAIPALKGALVNVRSGRMLNNITFALQRLGDPKLMERLRGFLQHRQAFIRLNAAFAVGDMKIGKARLLLEKGLLDPNLIVRNQVTIALAKLGDKRSLPALEQAARRGKGLQKWLAMLAVMHISQGKQWRDRLWQDVVRGKTKKIRTRAAYVLAESGDHRAAPHLFSLMNRGGYSRAWELAKQLKSPLVQELVMQRLFASLSRHSTKDLRRMLSFVGPGRSKAYKRLLLGVLMTKWYRRSSRKRRYGYAKRRRVKRAFSLWGRKSGNGELEATLRHLGATGERSLRPWLAGFLSHRDYHVRSEARLALARVGSDASLIWLAKHLVNASDKHRPYLVRRLGLLPVSRLRRVFPLVAKTNDPFVRLAVSATLLRAGDAASLPVLYQMLRASQHTVRMRAFGYLKEALTPSMQKHLNRWFAAHRQGLSMVTRDLVLRLLRRRVRTVSQSFSYFAIRRVELR
jgi:HEAT repeat protein